MVIREGKIANYQPYPPTPWNGNLRDAYGTPGPYEDAVQNTPIFEENGLENFKGVDIMRAVHSFDPCLPCGAHVREGQGPQGRPHADGDVLTSEQLIERVQTLTAQRLVSRTSARALADELVASSSSSTATGWSGSSRRSRTTCAIGWPRTASSPA